MKRLPLCLFLFFLVFSLLPITKVFATGVSPSEPSAEGTTQRSSPTVGVNRRVHPLAKGELPLIYSQAVKDYKAGRLLSASEKFNSILKVDPAYKRTKKYVSRIKQKIEELAKKEAEVSYAKGFIFYQEGNFSEAIAEWQKMLKINPEHNEVKEYMKKVEKILAEREKERIEREKQFDFHWRQMRYYMANKRYAEAVVDGGKAWKLKPDHKEVKKLLFQAIEKVTAEEANKIRQEYKNKAITDFSNEIEKHFQKGLREYSAGNLFKAVKEWEVAIQLDPLYKEAATALEKAKRELGLK